MRRVRSLPGVGVALGAAGGLWVAPAFAQDAGVDAGAPSEQRPIAAGALVYPPAGATDVVLNPGLILRLDQTILDPSLNPRGFSPDAPALGEGLLLRDDSGRLLAAGSMVTVETARPFAAPQPLANAHVEISTGPFALSPQAHYQVLSRVAMCPVEGGVRIACLQEEYVEISDFTTGTEVDREGPMIASVDQGASPGQCLTALSVMASDDHAAPSALRFGTDALAFLGPNVLLPTPSSTRERRTTLSVVPIDPSNNRGPALEVDVEACFLPVTDLSPPAPARPASPAREAASPSSGCAVAPGLGTSAIGVAVTPFALLTVLGTARRRARQRR